MNAEDIAREIFIRRASDVRPGWNFDAAANAKQSREIAQVYVDSQPQPEPATKPKSRPRKETA